MAARLPLRALLRDIVMMLCGSFLGILLSQGFASHDFNMADLSRLCGALQVSKKIERSRVGLRDEPVAMTREGSGLEGERRRVGMVSGIYPYSGYAGSGSASTERLKSAKLKGRSFHDATTTLGSGSGGSSKLRGLYQDMMNFLDMAVNQDMADQEDQDKLTYQDAVNDQDALSDQDRHDIERTMDGSSLYQDKWSYQDMHNFQDRTNYQDRQDSERTDWIYQDTSNQDTTEQQADSSLRLFVGVVTDHAHLSRTMEATMDTWGQSASNLTFYSIINERREEGKEEERWAWHELRRRGRRRRMEERKEEKMWAWQEGRSERGTERVVSIKYKPLGSNFAPLGAMETIPVLQHMQANLMDQFDWFLLVPEGVHIRLNQLEHRLKQWDPNIAFLFGRADSAVPKVGVGGGCGLKRGVVLSKRYLWDLTGEMEALIDSGVCRAGPLLWRCLYRHVVGRKEGRLNCMQDSKISQAFTDVASPDDPTHPTPPSSSSSLNDPTHLAPPSQLNDPAHSTTTTTTRKGGFPSPPNLHPRTQSTTTRGSSQQQAAFGKPPHSQSTMKKDGISTTI